MASGANRTCRSNAAMPAVHTLAQDVPEREVSPRLADWTAGSPVFGKCIALCGRRCSKLPRNESCHIDLRCSRHGDRHARLKERLQSNNRPVARPPHQRTVGSSGRWREIPINPPIHGREGTFPKPIRVSPGRIAWSEAEIAAWQKERMQERDVCGSAFADRTRPAAKLPR